MIFFYTIKKKEKEKKEKKKRKRKKKKRKRKVMISDSCLETASTPSPITTSMCASGPYWITSTVNTGARCTRVGTRRGSSEEDELSTSVEPTIFVSLVLVRDTEEGS
jgi:hypothetical protein